MQKKRFQSVDLLKGLAMLMVILVHYNETFANQFNALRFGQMGFQIFFVLSGFVTVGSFEKKLSVTGRFPAIKDFYVSRFMSIAPSYYAMMLAMFILQSILIPIGYGLNFATNRNPLDILYNVLFIHGLIPSANNTVMFGGWYIGTTMLLYLVTPAVVFLFRRWNQKKLLWAIMSVLSIALLFLMDIVIGYENLVFANNSFGYYFVLNQFPCYAIGMLLYYETQNGSMEKNRVILSFAVGAAVMAAAVVLFFYPIFEEAYIVTVQLVGIATYFILKSALALEQHFNFEKIFNSASLKPLIKLGSISLYVYLVHGIFVRPFIGLLRKIFDKFRIDVDNGICFLILLPIAVFLSYFAAWILRTVIGKITGAIFKKA